MEGDTQALIGDLVPRPCLAAVSIELGDGPLGEGQTDVLRARGNHGKEPFEVVAAQDRYSALGICRTLKGGEAVLIEGLDPMSNGLPGETLLAGDLRSRNAVLGFEDDLVSVVDPGWEARLSDLVPEVPVFPGCEFPKSSAARCSSSHSESRWQIGEWILPASEAGRPRRGSILRYAGISLELH